mgnify:CR=1 FL=1
MNMDDKKIDELINKALQEEQALPEGLSRRLEEQINAWAATEEKKTRSLTRRRTLYWLSGVAASILLCIGFFQYDVPSYAPDRLHDTYTNPKMPPLPPKRLCSCCHTISIKVSAR